MNFLNQKIEILSEKSIIRNIINQLFQRKQKSKEEDLPYYTKELLFYNPPKDKNNKPLYVPIVIQNKDCLVWYLIGFWKSQNSIAEAMELSCVEDEDEYKEMKIVNPNAFNIFTIDSTRFNTILPNNKNELSMNDNEVEAYIDFIHNKTCAPNPDGHKDNDLLEDINLGFLTIDCDCGMRHTFKTNNDIPENDYTCYYCDKLLIAYTGIPDNMFSFDEGEV